MLINQNTTQENSKKCSKKKMRIYKFLAILLTIIVLSIIICINASAIVLQDVTGMDKPYPSLIMYMPPGDNYTEAYIEVSGADRIPSNAPDFYMETDNGAAITYRYMEIYSDNITVTGHYQTSRKFTDLYSSSPININLWEWSQLYEDNIIWQLPDVTSSIDTLKATYKIELPYFNNSAIMGTEPVELTIEKEVQPISTDGPYTYNIEIPEIDEIIEKTIIAIENESQSGITFQYKGAQLSENNYVSNVYAEDGSKITIDFKKALSTILVNVRMEFNENAAVPGINYINILNYNDYSVNSGITHLRTNDFRELVIENEFERSAEITIERQEKEVRILNWLGNAIKGIMNVEIFPNFSLGGLLSVIVMIPIILWILKLVAGG